MEGVNYIIIPDDTPEYIKKWLRDTEFETVAHMEGAMMAINRFSLGEKRESCKTLS